MRALTVIFMWGFFLTFVSEGARGQLVDSDALGSAVDALESQIEGARKGFLNNTDLPGSNLDSPDLDAPDPALCASLCAKDEHCKAWTFRRPRPGIRERCDLKHEVPTAARSSCCVSGIKSAAGASGEENICDIDIEKMHGPNKLCMSYWEVPKGSEGRVRHVHIVNSYFWEQLDWKAPVDWEDTIYNECIGVYEREVERCDQMKKGK